MAKHSRIGYLTIALILLAWGAYSYLAKKSHAKDFMPPNGVHLVGTITYISGGRASFMVGVKYEYEQKVIENYFGTYNIHGLRPGMKVRMVVSKLHPGDGMKYLGPVNIENAH